MMNEKKDFDNIIKDKSVLYIFLMIFSLIFIIVDKFVLTFEYGWLELISFIVCIILLIFSIIKLYQLSNLLRTIKITIEIITIFLILCFSMLSIDYKRHRNMYQPIFTISKRLLTTKGIDIYNGLGYCIIQDYDINIQTGKKYKSKSTFYLLGIKINEVYVIED